MNSKIKKLVSMLLVAVIVSTSALVMDGSKVEAAVEYITVEVFAKSLAEELGLYPVSGSEQSQYVNTLINVGIIKAGDFTSYTGELTRTDAAVLINRADEYLQGDTLDTDLVTVALEKRISDIKKIDESKRTDVAKAYLKGFIKGYSNGAYSTDREFRGSKKISKAGALELIKMLKDKKLRANISPDGQLIRTTKLPKNADLFPYILASYPNKYYDGIEFTYQRIISYDENGKERELENLVDYAAPVDVDKTTKYDDFPTLKKANIDNWVKKVKTHFECVFNVDYRTIDDRWVETLLSVNSVYGSLREDIIRDEIKEYVKQMKSNKTVVEVNSIAVDGSSLYYTDGYYYLRVYVKYKVISSKFNGSTDYSGFINDRYHNKILFNRRLVDLGKINLDNWMEGYFDVTLSEPRNEGNLGVLDANLHQK